MNNCNHVGCLEVAKIKGFCVRHYKRFNATGSSESGGATHGTTTERFWRYVSKGESCWLWTGTKDKDGYGMLSGKKPDGKRTQLRPHRISYELHIGEIPCGVFVLHKCNNPACVNPEHLYSGTHNENMKDRIDAGHYSVGEKHPNAKITESIAREILASKQPAKIMAEKFGISESQIKNIRRGEQWKHLQNGENK